MSGGGKKPKIPDFGPEIGQSSDIFDTSTSNASQTFNTARGYNDAAQKTLSDVTGQQSDAMKRLQTSGNENLDAYSSTFLPLLTKQANDAANYASPEAMADARGRAVADTNAATESQLQNSRSRLAASGVDPNSIQGRSLDSQARVQAASNAANAAQQAALAREQQGAQMVSAANQVGLQAQAQGVNATGQAANIGSQQVQETNQTNQSGIQNLTAANQYLQTGVGATNAGTQAKGTAGQLSVDAAKTANQNNQNTMSQGLDVAGSIWGQYGDSITGMFSGGGGGAAAGGGSAASGAGAGMGAEAGASGAAAAGGGAAAAGGGSGAAAAGAGAAAGGGAAAAGGGGAAAAGGGAAAGGAAGGGSAAGATGGLGLGAVAGIAAAGWLAAEGLNNWFAGNGDEKRNLSAFGAAMNVHHIYNPAAARLGGGNDFSTPSGATIKMNDLQSLAGAWYGATVAPDGDQAKWKQQYNQQVQDLNKKYGKDLGFPPLGDDTPAAKPQGALPPPNYNTQTLQYQPSGAFMQSGGAVPSPAGYATGGVVSGQGALPSSPKPGSTDTVPAFLTPDEFVIPKDVATWKGHEYWYKELDKVRSKMSAHQSGIPSR